MQNKNLIKIAIVFVLCSSVALACNHMPQILQVIYDGVFKEFDFPRFLFIVGVLVFEVIILKRWENEKRYYICLGGVFIVSALTLTNGHSDLYEKLRPAVDVTAIDQDLCIWSKNLFRQYYFDDKNLIVSSEEKANESDYSYIYKMDIPPEKVIIGNDIVISDELKSRILSYPRWRDELCRYVIDEYWESTNNIRLVKLDEKYIFCSEEVIENAQNYVMISDGNTQEESSDARAILGEKIGNQPFKSLKQVVALFALVIVGLLIVLPLWGKDYPILAFSLCFPIGVASWCICGLLFMVFSIPYNLYTMWGCLAILTGGWIFKNWRVCLKLNWQLLLNFMLIAVGIIVLLVYSKICFMTSDSIGKCVMGYRLAQFGSIRDILGDVAPYGILEAMVISIGYMVNCDLLYSFYPLMALSGISVMCVGTHYINIRKNSKDRYMSKVILGGGVIFLLTNYDFLLSIFYVMSHGSIAVYMLISIVFIIMKRQFSIPGFEYILMLAGTMILITRVEGAIYVLFVLVAALGIENQYLKMKKVNIVMSLIIIMWNCFQIFVTGTNGDPAFWTPEKGVLLIVGAIATLTGTLIIDKEWGIMQYLKSHYFSLLILAIGIGVIVAAFFNRDMASINLSMYASHFSNSAQNNTNAAALWTFVLLLCPIVVIKGREVGKYAITYVGGYLIFVYFISLFRTGLPIHLGYTDSSRRMLVHIMPTAIWLLANCIENDNDIKVKEG